MNEIKTLELIQGIITELQSLPSTEAACRVAAISEFVRLLEQQDYEDRPALAKGRYHEELQRIRRGCLAHLGILDLNCDISRATISLGNLLTRLREQAE